MASKFQIQLQYRTALQQASRLEELAENLLRTARTGVGETMSELQICWTGENARAFIQKEEALRDRIVKRADLLRRTAEEIRKAADALYKAEMSALELAQRRDS